MTRPPLEVADLVRAAGTAFIERNRHWLRWTHLKVLLAMARCRTAALGGHIDECTRCGHRSAISYKLPQSPLPKVSDRRSCTLDPGTSPRTSAFTLCPCGFHSAGATGCPGFTEQEGHLCFAVSCQRRNPTRSGSYSQASRCRDRLLQRSAYLEPETPDSGVYFAGSLSTDSSRPFCEGSCTFLAIWLRSLNLSSSPPGSGRCFANSGWFTPNHRSAAPSTCSATLPATPIVSPSPTTAWFPRPRPSYFSLARLRS